MSIIFKGGVKDVSVPTGQKIAINCENGTAIVYYSTSPASPDTFYESSRVTNGSSTLGTFTSDRVIRIEAKGDNVTYDVAVTPAVLSINHNDLEGLDGGTTDEYYHLTSSKYAYANAMDQSVATTVSPTFSGMVSTGDIYNTAWTDYGGTSTVTGWSSTSTKVINYKRVGNLVFVGFYINGTSDSVNTSFTLPITSSNTSIDFGGAMETAYDNSVNLTVATRVSMDPNGTLVAMYTDMATGVWTASGTKIVRGSFWYEAA